MKLLGCTKEGRQQINEAKEETEGAEPVAPSWTSHSSSMTMPT